jgi:nucleoside-diphosphate-sugar epimerase
MSSHVLIVGYGYVGGRLAVAERALGREVVVVTRREEAAARARASGLGVVEADLDRPDSLGPLAEAAAGGVVHHLAPPPRDGEVDSRLEAWLNAGDAASLLPRRVVLVSTSGVYGSCDGAWVDESRPVAPGTARARRRVAAERALAHFAQRRGVEHVVVRVPGIYGPGRLPAERLRRGDPVIDPSQATWTNRIHVEDLVRCLQAAAHVDSPPRIVNVSDGTPGTMTEYFEACADALGLPAPPRIDLEEARRVFSRQMLSYLEESRRLVVERMRRDLGVEPRYPTLREGLAASVDPPRGEADDR